MQLWDCKGKGAAKPRPFGSDLNDSAPDKGAVGSVRRHQERVRHKNGKRSAASAERLREAIESEQRDRVAGLRAQLSDAYWDELRRHERLSVAAATRTLSASIHALLRS